MIRFVTTHVLAAELSEPGNSRGAQGRTRVHRVRSHRRQHRLYLASRQWFRARRDGRELGVEFRHQALAAAPHRCRFTVLRNGAQIYHTAGLELDWPVPAPGVYRVEAELKVGQEWTPWVYANPIWIR